MAISRYWSIHEKDQIDTRACSLSFFMSLCFFASFFFGAAMRDDPFAPDYIHLDDHRCPVVSTDN